MQKVHIKRAENMSACNSRALPYSKRKAVQLRQYDYGHSYFDVEPSQPPQSSQEHSRSIQPNRNIQSHCSNSKNRIKSLRASVKGINVARVSIYVS